MVERVLPCGIPCVMVLKSDCACCVCVDWRLSVKYDLKKSRVPGVKWKMCFSLWNSLWWETVSYALDKSTYTAIVGSFLFLCACMSLSMDCRARVVLEPGLNAYCVGDIMLLSSRCAMSCVFTI